MARRMGTAGAALALSALLLGACSSMRESLGMTKKAPDEFAVVPGKPLIMPPDYSLRPPRPGEKQAKELDSQAQAIAALFPGRTSLPPKSAGERALLSQAGANEVDASVRSQVSQPATLVADKGVFLREILDTSDGLVDSTATSIEHMSSAPLAPPQ
ncbi:MAG: DUF3035 domain-containing protein [Pseudomonadota bacterium]